VEADGAHAGIIATGVPRMQIARPRAAARAAGHARRRRAPREAARNFGERLTDIAKGARSRTDDLMHGAGRERVEHLRERSMRMFDEQPPVLGAVGTAIGAAFGAALRPTRREDALMGGMHDERVAGAKETAREQMQGVKASARRVAETAREEVGHAIDPPQGAGVAAGEGPRPGATH
jgi:hypothetical protein